MSAETKETTDPFDQFQPGDSVKHPKFGEGQILHRSGSGEDTKLVVAFAEEGEKRLMARFAKLKKVRPIQTESEAEEPAPPAAAADVEEDEELEDMELEDDELDEDELGDVDDEEEYDEDE